VKRKRTRGDLKDSLHVSGDAHLLGELRRLSEESGSCSRRSRRREKRRVQLLWRPGREERREDRLTVEVGDLENTGSTLGSSSLELGSVDLDEVLLDEELPEERTDGGLDLEDGEVGVGLGIEERRGNGTVSAMNSMSRHSKR